MGKLKSNIERGRRIVDARKKLRMTQEQLAERVTTFKRAQKKDATAVSRGAIGNWEQGLGLTTENLNCLAEVLGTSAQWILTGELNHEISLSKATVTSLVLPVIGKVQAGVWEEIDLVDQSEFADTHLMVPLDPRFSAENQYLLKIVGDSVNEFAKSGSYAHCVDMASGLEVTNGHMVVVARSRPGCRDRTNNQRIPNRQWPERIMAAIHQPKAQWPPAPWK